MKVVSGSIRRNGPTVNLKMKYHNRLGELVIIVVDLCGAFLIHSKVLNNPFAIVITSERGKKNFCEAVGNRP